MTRAAPVFPLGTDVCPEDPARSIEILVSTMDRRDYGFLQGMGLRTPTLVINQNGESGRADLMIAGQPTRVICSDERGLSRSRNLAVENASGYICVLADDDVVFSEDYERVVASAYATNPDADVIAFQVERIGTQCPKVFRDRPQWETYWSCMRVSSVEITFRRDRVRAAGLRFNVLMGAGAEFFVGEENIFLWDAIRAGLRVLYLPVQIGSVDCSQSSWFNGYTDSYFRSLGAAYYNMSPRLWQLLSLQWVVRKHALYKGEMSPLRALRQMFAGAAEYRRLASVSMEANA